MYYKCQNFQIILNKQYRRLLCLRPSGLITNTCGNSTLGRVLVAKNI